MSRDKDGDFITPKDDFVISPVCPTPLGGQIRESFNIEDDGDVSGGHTTIETPGGNKIRVPWNP